MLIGDPLKIKSIRCILCGKKTLMNFYEDREEEEEEDIEVRGRRRKRIVLMSQRIRFRTFFLYTQASFYII